MLVEAAPPLVSFTFGLPEPAAAAGAQAAAGCTLVQTVTSPDEALPVARGRDGRADRAVARRRRSLGHLHPGAAARAAPAPRAGPRRAGGRRPPDAGRRWRSAPAPTCAAALEAGAAGSRGRHPRCCSPPEAGTNPAHRAGLRRRTAATRSRPGAFSGRPRRRAAQRLPGGVRRPRPARATRPCTTSPARSARAAAAAATPSTSTSGPAPATGTSRRARPGRSSQGWCRDRAACDVGVRRRLEDPSEDALIVMFQDLEAGAGPSSSWSRSRTPRADLVQAARGDDGAYVVEYRQGSADQHFQTTCPDVPRGTRAA